MRNLDKEYKPFVNSIATLLLLVGLESTAKGDELVFGESLGGVPCQNQGTIILTNDAFVKKGENVKCVATAGTIEIEELTVDEGANFQAVAQNVTYESAPWAETTCTLGSVDCNVCATNVQTQMDQLFGIGVPFDKRVRNKVSTWHYDPDDRYQPSNRRAKSAFGSRIRDHIQGFVKTNHSSVAFAGTHSEEDRGSVFFVQKPFYEGRSQLTSIHDAWSHHPSGLSVLGNFVIFGDDSGDHLGRELRIMNLSNLDFQKNNFIFFEDWKEDGDNAHINFGGGVGAAKLAGGGYLLVTTGPGGPIFGSGDNSNIKPRYTDFFYLMGEPTDDRSRLKNILESINYNEDHLEMEYFHLGRWYQDSFGPKEKSKSYQYSENVTLIPECGTGDIYVLHTSNKKPHAAAQESWPGYWRLSRIEWDDSGPKLNILDVYEEDQDYRECFHRAAASAWVNQDHEIELYCSEYRSPRRSNISKGKFRYKRRWLEQR